MNSIFTKTEFNAWPGRLIRRLRRRHNDQCVNIVTYHSVSKEPSIFTDKTGLRHHPAEFERQVDYLAENYNPISLRELIYSLEEGLPLHRAVVLTFDDGWEDSIRRVMPILFRWRIPMTVIPVTSVIGNVDLMWQHKLAWLLANDHEDRVRDALRSEGFPLNEGNELLTVFSRQCFRADLPGLLEEVLCSVGTNGRALAEKHRPYLEPEEIANANPDEVEFGNHTDTHPVLSALTADEQKREIVTARDKIRDLTGYEPLAMSYPFGLKRHYNDDTRQIVRMTGHRASLDMRRRINFARVDPLDLSRKPAIQGSQQAFEKLIEDWPANAPLHPAGGSR